MVRYLVLWATWSAGVIAAADAATIADAPREWIDASGTRRAQAALIGIDGDVVRLHRADGKIVTTQVERLSARDRQYVAARRAAFVAKLPTAVPQADDSRSSASTKFSKDVSDALEALNELPAWTEAMQNEARSSVVPAALLYVKLSRGFLEKYVERDVQRQKPVRDCVLGTTITGESNTHGRTELTLLPSNDRLMARIGFEGSLRSYTRGSNGPARFRYISDTTFKADKLITLDDGGMNFEPARVTSETELRTVGVSSTLPGLRGRIATRIASRRMSQSHARAEEITEDHTAEDIREGFDTSISTSLAKLERVLSEQIPELETAGHPMPTDVRFRCRPDSVEMAILREDATAEERKLRPPPALENADVSLRVHRIVLTTALEDPELMVHLSPLFTRLMESRKSAANAAGKKQPTWSFDMEWVSMDFDKAEVGELARGEK